VLQIRVHRHGAQCIEKRAAGQQQQKRRKGCLEIAASAVLQRLRQPFGGQQGKVLVQPRQMIERMGIKVFRCRVKARNAEKLKSSPSADKDHAYDQHGDVFGAFGRNETRQADGEQAGQPCG